MEYKYTKHVFCFFPVNHLVAHTYAGACVFHHALLLIVSICLCNLPGKATKARTFPNQGRSVEIPR